MCTFVRSYACVNINMAWMPKHEAEAHRLKCMEIFIRYTAIELGYIHRYHVKQIRFVNHN